MGPKTILLLETPDQKTGTPKQQGSMWAWGLLPESPIPRILGLYPAFYTDSYKGLVFINRRPQHFALHPSTNEGAGMVRLRQGDGMTSRAVNGPC